MIASPSHEESPVPRQSRPAHRTLSPTRPALSPGPRPAGMRKNKISFGGNSTVVFEKDIEEDEQKNAVWYSKKEMKSIRKDLKKEIKTGEVSRGLEVYADGSGTEHKIKRLTHVRSILALQSAQQEAGIQDHVGLGSLSKSMSADNLRRARRLASLDSTEAFHEYQEFQNSPFLKAKNAKEYAKGATSAGKNATFGLKKSQKSTPNMFLSSMNSKTPKPPSKSGLAALRAGLSGVTLNGTTAGSGSSGGSGGTLENTILEV